MPELPDEAKPCTYISFRFLSIKSKKKKRMHQASDAKIIFLLEIERDNYHLACHLVNRLGELEQIGIKQILTLLL